jgi:hypothetical protein
MTGNFHIFASMAKCFPHCVAKIYTPEDYAPFVLSGIVQSNKESVTTKLEVGVRPTKVGNAIMTGIGSRQNPNTP